MEYDYEAQHTDELTIRVGDVVTDLAPTEPGWMRGKLRGKVGVFPDNFVKVGHSGVPRRISSGHAALGWLWGGGGSVAAVGWSVGHPPVPGWS